MLTQGGSGMVPFSVWQNNPCLRQSEVSDSVQTLFFRISPTGKHPGTMDTVLPRQIVQAFEPILGIPAWQVRQGDISFLTLEFGEPRLEIIEPNEQRRRRSRIVTIRGDWHLWIYCCGWDIAQNGKRLAHWESENEAIAKATAQLDGQCLEKLWMEPGTVITHFEFDLGGELRTHPFDVDRPYEQWMLYEPSGDVLSVRSDNRFSHGPGDAPPDEERWLPIFHIYDS